MTYRTTARLGTLSLQVDAPTLHELLQELEYLRDLDRAREGAEDAEPFLREWDGNRFFGFRRADGAEVLFGRSKEPKSLERPLFSYAPTSDGYRGWERWDGDRCERVPAISAEVHQQFLRFIQKAGPAVDDTAAFEAPSGPKKGKAVKLKEFARTMWNTIKTDPLVARAVARAIERETGLRMEG